MPTVVLDLDPERAPDVRRALEGRRWKIERRDHSFFLARGPGATVTFYESGKVLLTGPDAEAIATLVQAAAGGRTTPRGSFAARIGSDESGKGDTFGPLVVAAVAIPDAGTEAALRNAKVRDSKDVDDAEVGRIADRVETECPFEFEALRPTEYNARYAEVRNLNTLLASLHAEVIRRLAAKVNPRVRRVVVDRFARAPLVTRALAPLDVEVEERVRAEDDLAVAAASIVARRQFLVTLRVLSEEAGVPLPKGSSRGIAAARTAIREKWGPEGLDRFSKTHFR